MKYQLEEPFSLTFSIWKEGKDDLESFMRIVVAKKVGNGKYQYVASKLEAFYQEMYLECPDTDEGQYYIMLMICGSNNFSSDVKFMCYKRLRGQLSNIVFKPCSQK